MPRTRKTARATQTATAAPEGDPDAALPASSAPAGDAGEEPTESRPPRVTSGPRRRIPEGDVAGGFAVRMPRQAGREGTDGEPRRAPAPDQKISVSLNGVAGGPTMQLIRSNRYQQMQIRFQGEQPGDDYLEMLRKVGWTDRTQTEGVWTKRFDPNGRWQSVQKMEQEFKDVANAIREGNGLGPVLEGLVA